VKWAAAFAAALAAAGGFVWWRRSAAAASEEGEGSEGETVAPPESPMSEGSPIENPDPEDAYALARCMTSEEGGAAEIVRAAVCFAIVNYANAKGKSPTAVIKTKRTYYGYGPQSDGSYVSSREEASSRDLDLAGRIVSGAYADPGIEGATQFDNPATQDWQYERGQVKKSADMVARDRMAEGKRAVYLPGVDPRKFRLWTKAPASGGVA